MARLLSLFLICCLSEAAFSSGQEVQNPNAKPLQARRILVVYYSRTGTTKKIAHEIASKLNADIEEIIDKKDRSGLLIYFTSGNETKNGKLTDLAEMKINPKDYNLVIIGTPVWDETVSTPVRSYLVKYKDKLPDNIAFFTTSRMTEAETAVKNMEKITGKPAISFTGFASFLGDLSNERKDKKIQDFVNSLKP